jgi:MFS family permease
MTRLDWKAITRFGWTGGLDQAFVRLWFGQTVSQLGSQVSLVAIPLLAVLSLHATPLEMGILTAAETVPFVLVALPAGVLVDRVDRRVLMIVCDVGRVVSLLAIPALWVSGMLTLPLLAVIAFVTGCLSVGFDVAAATYLPEIVPAESLVVANQRLELATSGAQVVGPGLGGLLFNFVGGALAVVVDALSYAASAISLARIRVRRHPDGADVKPDVRDRAALRWQLVDGPRIVLGDRVLRDLALSTAAFNLASSMILATFALFATRDLGISAAGFGLIFAIGNVGFVLGAMASVKMASRGLGHALTVSAIGSTIATLIIPFAGGPLAPLILLSGRFAGALANPIFNVSLVTLIQARTDRRSLGRVTGTFRLVDWSLVPVGALLGGALAEVIGIRSTLFVASAIALVQVLLMLNSPARRIRQVQPTAASEEPLPGVGDIVTAA